jgi:hypothetical protein
MLHLNKYVTIVIAIIIVCCVAISFHLIKEVKPQNILESKIKLKLPPKSKVVKYQYNYFAGDFYIKILIDNESVNSLKEQLNSALGGVSDQKYPQHINFQNTCEWWDLDNKKIEVSYHMFVSDIKRLFGIGYSRKSHEIWAFISKEENGQYYLYISY